MNSRLLLGCSGLAITVACVNGAGGTTQGIPSPSGGEDPPGSSYEPPGGGQDPSGGGQDPSGGGNEPAPGVNDPTGGGACVDCGTYTCSITDAAGTLTTTVVVQLSTLQSGNGCGVENASGAELLCNGTIVAPIADGGFLEPVGTWSHFGEGLRGTAPINIQGVASGITVTFTCQPGGSASSSSSSGGGSGSGSPPFQLDAGGITITFDAG
jgi:hypothetical protein